MKTPITINIDGKEYEGNVPEDAVNDLVGKYLRPVKQPIWKPKRGEPYCFINNDGVICKTFWANFPSDIYRWETSNCYKTEDEAGFYVTVNEVTGKLRNFAREHNETVIERDVVRFYITWNWATRSIKIFRSTYCTGGVAFSSEETAYSAINEIGEGNVIEYYLRVR